MLNGANVVWQAYHAGDKNWEEKPNKYLAAGNNHMGVCSFLYFLKMSMQTLLCPLDPQ
jgi:hypothetical protein